VHTTTDSSPAPDRAAQPDAVVADVTALLRAHAERMTGPRRAVVSALAVQTRHVTAEELVRAVAAVDARVHRASVYRTLEALTDLGVVQHIHVGHGPTVYHLVGAAGAHPHAQCHSCGALVDLPPGLLDDVAARMRAETGFALDATHMALSGTCVTCADVRQPEG
jgi:Fe2+ or Zn2+ uptake regulation protein